MGLCLLSFLGCRNQTLPDGSQKHGAESAGKKGGSANGSESNPKNDPSLSRVTQKKGKGSAVVPPAKKDFEFVWRKDTGIQFVHQSGFDEKRAFPAANGSGLGIIDFDRDGLEDIQFASGKFFPLDPADHRSPCQLYRNLGNWKFENCSKEAGAEENGYAVGITVGDFDNDGFQDFYVGCYGENALYINRGDGSFEKMNGEGLPKGRPSRPEGLDPSVPDTPGWATSSAFLDFDGDGNLDLYVGNYGIWDLNLKKNCGDLARNEPRFCSPTTVRPQGDVLYQNNGDGTFTDVSERAGIYTYGKGKNEERIREDFRTQGVIATDLNGDGWIDIYCGNDMNANLMLNQQR